MPTLSTSFSRRLEPGDLIDINGTDLWTIVSLTDPHTDVGAIHITFLTSIGTFATCKTSPVFDYVQFAVNRKVN